MESINFNEWVTQQQLANELSNSTGSEVSVQRVHNWIARNKIEAKAFPQLNNQVLVNKTTLNIKTIK